MINIPVNQSYSLGSDLSAGIVMELVYSSEVNDGGNVSFDWVDLGYVERLLALLTPQQTVTVVHSPFRLTCLSCSTRAKPI